jgi:hypothetical protein
MASPGPTCRRGGIRQLEDAERMLEPLREVEIWPLGWDSSLDRRRLGASLAAWHHQAREQVLAQDVNPRRSRDLADVGRSNSRLGEWLRNLLA